MCNFIIRPVEAYATVDIYEDTDTLLISAGDKFKVERVEGDTVVGLANNSAGVAIPLSTYIHTFSLQNPKQEKKESK